MNFDDTPQEAEFRATARAWIGANAPKQYEDELRKSSLGRTQLKNANILEVAKSWQKKKADAGWACLHWPKEYGGRGSSPIERVIWQQEEGAFGKLSHMFIIGHGMCGPTMMAFAREEHKRTYLPPLASGEKVWCQLFSEPQRLGEVGDGWNVSLTTLMNERMSIGAGVSTGFPELFEYCASLMLDDGPAIEDRAVRSKLANWAVKASGLRYTSMRAISAPSKGERPGPENSIGKLVAGSMIQDVATYALDLQGAAGVVSDPEDAELAGRFQAMLLRAPGTRVEGGTDEIMRNIIAERVLGLPGDIRVDKDVPFNKIPTKGRG